MQQTSEVLEVSGKVAWKIAQIGYWAWQDRCDIIEKSITRHRRWIEAEAVGQYHTPAYKSVVERISVKVAQGCTDAYPDENMDESYSITVSAPEVVISSAQVWGALRAIETMSQLIYPDPQHVRLLVNRGSVVDKPKYSYRGFMIDTSRHYIPMQIIMKQLDAMEAVKLNVLHWHLTDDHSFPYVSEVYPELSRKGAYNQHTHVYTAKDINEVIQEARLRGIRVIPELDIPAHTRSWSKGHPEMFNQCSRKKFNEGKGPLLDIENSQTFKVLEKLIGEISNVFRDKNFHLGGDEFYHDCIPGSTPSIVNFFQELRSIIGRVSGSTTIRAMFWQDLLKMGATVPQNSIVNVWKHWVNDENYLKQAISTSNISIIVSHPWYLDNMSRGEKWRLNYDVEMFKQLGDSKVRSRVIGGQACLWAEFVDATNFLQWAWPDAGGTAENLWSDKVPSSKSGDVQERMNELRCRLIVRGIPARPIQAGFCDTEWAY
ncbi:beta-hexosaminidase subunit beta-like [Symsagittifera roscoffensis]|uniref:beta-hexosaminidase subunit beta-like n=1 Tax=Symsagittifera roscoffensis TaxID=84072 RepID=UPI00307CB3C2